MGLEDKFIWYVKCIPIRDLQTVYKKYTLKIMNGSECFTKPKFLTIFFCELYEISCHQYRFSNTHKSRENRKYPQTNFSNNQHKNTSGFICL